MALSVGGVLDLFSTPFGMLILTGAGAVVGGTAAFLLQRWWKGEVGRERMADTHLAAQIAALMKEKGIGHEDIGAVFQEVRTDRFIKEASAGTDQPMDFRGESMAVMRTRAGGEADVDNAKMLASYHLLLTISEVDEQKIIEASQEAWELFREAQLEVAGLPMRGGTGETSLCTAEYGRLAKARKTELDALLQFYQDTRAD